MPEAVVDWLIAILACPQCAGGLHQHEGILKCESCGRRYPVTRGIPRFVPNDHYAESFGLQWQRHRREQLDTHTGTGLSRKRLWTETGWEPESLAGSVILDAGCGAGRFADVAAECAKHVVAVDLSLAVEAARETLARHGNVAVVQASLLALPFKPGSFDAIYCIGVAQHTPEPLATLASLPRVLKPGGRLAVTVYERKAWTKLNGKYLVRPFTRRLPSAVLAGILRFLMPVLFTLSEILFRIPIAGRLFRFLLPVANYVGQLPLTLRQRYEWALLDTFDMLAPVHDHPLTESEIRRILSTSVSSLRRLPNPGLNVVGERTDANPSLARIERA